MECVECKRGLLERPLSVFEDSVTKKFEVQFSPAYTVALYAPWSVHVDKRPLRKGVSYYHAHCVSRKTKKYKTVPIQELREKAKLLSQLSVLSFKHKCPELIDKVDRIHQCILEFPDYVNGTEQPIGEEAKAFWDVLRLLDQYPELETEFQRNYVHELDQVGRYLNSIIRVMTEAQKEFSDTLKGYQPPDPEKVLQAVLRNFSQWDRRDPYYFYFTNLWKELELEGKIFFEVLPTITAMEKVIADNLKEKEAKYHLHLKLMADYARVGEFVERSLCKNIVSFATIDEILADLGQMEINLEAKYDQVSMIVKNIDSHYFFNIISPGKGKKEKNYEMLTYTLLNPTQRLEFTNYKRLLHELNSKRDKLRRQLSLLEDYLRLCKERTQICELRDIERQQYEDQLQSFWSKCHEVEQVESSLQRIDRFFSDVKFECHRIFQRLRRRKNVHETFQRVHTKCEQFQAMIWKELAIPEHWRELILEQVLYHKHLFRIAFYSPMKKFRLLYQIHQQIQMAREIIENSVYQNFNQFQEGFYNINNMDHYQRYHELNQTQKKIWMLSMHEDFNFESEESARAKYKSLQPVVDYLQKRIVETQSNLSTLQKTPGYDVPKLIQTYYPEVWERLSVEMQHKVALENTLSRPIWFSETKKIYQEKKVVMDETRSLLKEVRWSIRILNEIKNEKPDLPLVQDDLASYRERINDFRASDYREFNEATMHFLSPVLREHKMLPPKIYQLKLDTEKENFEEKKRILSLKMAWQSPSNLKNLAILRKIHTC